MAGNTTVNAAQLATIEEKEKGQDKEKFKGTPYRLRNHSYQQANISNNAITQGSSETPPNPNVIQEEEEEGDTTADRNSRNMGSMEDIISERFLLRKDDWQGKSVAFKLDSVFDAVNKMYSLHAQCMERIKPLEYAVFDPEGGILPQLTNITSHTKTVTDQQASLQAENAQLRDEMEIVKGVISKQGKQIAALQSKLADQTARLMSDCVVISGILRDSASCGEEESKALAANFLENEMEIDTESDEILNGYRLGRFQEGKNRPIVIKITPSLQRKIFSNTTKLADKVNSNGRPFSVNPLLPDSLAEQRREIRQIIKDKKEAERGLPKEQKSNFLVKNGKVFINGQAKKKAVLPPDFRNLFVDEDEQLKINKIKTKTVEAKPVKGSKFRAAAINAPTLNDVHLAYIKMFQTYPHADHIVVAFSTELQLGFHDNGEYGAGSRVLKVIKDSHLGNVAIFVIREYGGENLGPARFDIIRGLAEQALQALS